MRWDSGRAANYRAGGTKFDLRIFDNAQVGKKTLIISHIHFVSLVQKVHIQY